MNSVLRWIAVPFAAVFAGIVAFYIAGFFLSILTFFDRAPDAYHDFFFSYLFVPVRNAISTFAFVVAGKVAAPTHNEIVSIVLATIVSMAIIILSVLTIVAMDIIKITDYIKILLNIIIVIAGAVYGASFHNEDLSEQ